MILTNTMLIHKMRHKSFWTTPERIENHYHHDGNPKRKPYRKQIDYVLIKNGFTRIVHNSQSYGGFEANSGHKAVITRLVEDDKEIYRKECDN